MGAEQLCGPFYEKNKTLGSAVSSAIASATAAAFAVVEARVPSNPAEWPLCAVSLLCFSYLAYISIFSRISILMSGIAKSCYHKSFSKLALINTYPHLGVVN